MKSHPVIGVLMGGCSSEREVSLRSGAAVADALKSVGHKVVPIDLQSEDLRELEGVHLDVAFIALHGRFGEDGRLQQLLQKRGIPYTGSGPDASRAAMDKVEAKRLFKLKHVETPPHRVIARGDSVDLMEHAARALGYPVVMKPRAEGSSVGVTVHEDRATLLDGAAECFRHDPIGLMEKFIQGRELTVGILDGKALPVIELRPKSRFFDYNAKYQDPDTQYIVNPVISDLDRRRVQKAAKDAHDALGCEGMSRVDIILTPFCSVHVLEVNTIPGLTARSLLPKAAGAAGISFPLLCWKITELAFKRKQGTFWAAAAMF
ncbi:MAG: D-alanine--D-alanine ligase [Planctomycetota bacterium]|nr:MAG: D-alanine--D-alanine ligase [Planctomycetota bacterium]